MSNVNSAVKTAKVSKSIVKPVVLPDEKVGELQARIFPNNLKPGKFNVFLEQRILYPFVSNSNDAENGWDDKFSYKETYYGRWYNGGKEGNTKEECEQQIAKWLASEGRMYRITSSSPIMTNAEKAGTSVFDIDASANRQALRFEDKATGETPLALDRNGNPIYVLYGFDITGKKRDSYVDAEPYVSPELADEIANRA